MNEHDAQKIVVAWFRKTYPQLSLVFFAIPNGGSRNPVVGKKLKEEGVLAGVPDLLLAVPRNGRAGLFLEMKKARTGRVRPEQKAVHEALREQGYAVEVAYGHEQAITFIADYLEPPSTGSS